MKKIVTVLATVAVAVGLTAGPAAAKPQADPPGLKTPGQLTVGLSMPAPGFQNVTPLPSGNNVLPASSAPKGMEIDMAKAIAKELGLTKIVYVQNNFQNMYLPGPKKWDFGLRRDDHHRRAQEEHRLLGAVHQRQPGRHDPQGPVAGAEDFADLKNIVLCAQIGTTGAAFIKDRVQPTKKALYPQTTTIMYQQLKSKRCDAALYDAPILGAQRFLEPKAYGPIIGSDHHERAVRRGVPEERSAPPRS